MNYICNMCGNIVQEHDVTIHYTKGSDGLEIVAVCNHCLEKYLETRKGENDRKDDEDERIRMERKW